MSKAIKQKLAEDKKSDLTGETLFRQVPFNIKSIDEEERTFVAIASTETTDRHGEIIKQDGWELDNYLKNPVGLLFHNSWDLPVFKTEEIGVVDGMLQFKAKFPTADEYDKADTVWKLYVGGYMRAFSVGFRVTAYDPENDTFLEQELLEISCVTVPANPDALVLAYKEGVISNDERKGLIGGMKEQIEKLEEIDEMPTAAEFRQIKKDLGRLSLAVTSLTKAAKSSDTNKEGDQMPKPTDHKKKGQKALDEDTAKVIGDVAGSLRTAADNLEALLEDDDSEEEEDADKGGEDDADTEENSDEEKSKADGDTDQPEDSEDNPADEDPAGGTEEDPEESEESDDEDGDSDEETDDDRPSDDEEVDPDNLSEDQAEEVERHVAETIRKEQGKVD